MAVDYLRNPELQDKRVQIRPVKDPKKKLAMKAFGYDETGGRTGLGKFYDAIAPATGAYGIAFQTAGRGVAKYASQGTDAETVLKETDDEFINQQATNLKFGLQAASAYSGATGGGDMSSLLNGGSSNQLQDMITQGNVASTESAIQQSVDAVDTDALTSSVGDAQYSFSGADVETKGSVNVTGRNDFVTPDYGSIDAGPGSSVDPETGEIITDPMDEATDAITSSTEANKEVEKEAKKQTQDFSKMLGEGGKLVQAGMEVYASNRELRREGDKAANKLLTRKRRPTYNLL